LVLPRSNIVAGNVRAKPDPVNDGMRRVRSLIVPDRQVRA
jgi:hypothetical protein